MVIADRLTTEGAIDVVIDEYDLKEGQDVNAFMERLSTDVTVHFCLVLSDAAYAKKANDRKRGVGVEAQIISKEVYDSIDQTKFVPVVMEIDEQGKPCLPVFLQNRKYIDFSSPEKINQNWEKLIRLLHGKPLRVRPQMGGLPVFLDDKVGFHFVKLRKVFQGLRVGLLEGKPGVAVLRDDMLETFCEELGEVSEHFLTDERSGDEIIAVWERQLRAQPVGRNLLIDWMLIEVKIDPDRAVNKCIIPLLERIADLPKVSKDIPVSPITRDTMACLGYELALYAMACLVEVDASQALKVLLEHPFQSRGSRRGELSIGLAGFQHYSQLADSWNSSQQTKWLSPLAEWFEEQASHSRIGFYKIVEAEALIFLFNLLAGNRYYPATAAYVERGPVFNWFHKAKLGQSPDRLALITGYESWSKIRDAFCDKFSGLLKGGGWTVFRYGSEEYISAMAFDER